MRFEVVLIAYRHVSLRDKGMQKSMQTFPVCSHCLSAASFRDKFKNIRCGVHDHLQFPLPIGIYPFQDLLLLLESLNFHKKFSLPISRYPFRDCKLLAEMPAFNLFYCLSACIPFGINDAVGEHFDIVVFSLPIGGVTLSGCA